MLKFQYLMRFGLILYFVKLSTDDRMFINYVYVESVMQSFMKILNNFPFHE